MLRLKRPFYSFFFCLLFVLPFWGKAEAQRNDQVEIFEDYLYEGQSHVYLLPDLRQGDVIYARLDYLDPMLDETALYISREGLTFYNDTYGGGFDYVTVQHVVMAAGDFELELQPREQANGDPAFGYYELTVGVNRPDILTGNVRRSADTTISLDEAVSTPHLIQTFTGTLQGGEQFSHYLPYLRGGDDFYAYFEITSESQALPGYLTLQHDTGDFLHVDTDYTEDLSARFLQFRVDEWMGYTLTIENFEAAPQDYRLILGINAPEVLTGESFEETDNILGQPTQIEVSFSVQQITNVDQKAENFSVVAVFEARWFDPYERFDPNECNCLAKTYADRALESYFFLGTSETLRWPEFIFLNQQGDRSIQHQVLEIAADGWIYYSERFTGTFQAPDFHFKSFPFDEQYFWVRLETPFFANTFQFSEMNGGDYERFGAQLGEEEWVIFQDQTRTEINAENVSRYHFEFWVKRHLDFYIYRLMVPLFLIVLVGWAIFFLDDIDARIAAATGNLLIFIAFNFTIADDLPRLGYLTFIDVLLMIGFVVTTCVFAVNVLLRRAQSLGHEGWSRRLDRVALVTYPSVFIFSTLLLALTYL